MTRKYTFDCVAHLQDQGFSFEDARALRRISMTLHNWYEKECGDSNNYGSWCIVRGFKNIQGFRHDDDGKPFMEQHHYRHGKGKDYTTYVRIDDKERGALKRLGAIMTRYPDYVSYLQTDPRGTALYIISKERLGERKADEYYSSLGIPVGK